MVWVKWGIRLILFWSRRKKTEHKKKIEEGFAWFINFGESRIVEFKKVLEKTGIKIDSPAGILYQSEEFSKVEIENDTLSWSNINQFITLRTGTKLQVPFEIGADVLLKSRVSQHLLLPSISSK